MSGVPVQCIMALPSPDVKIVQTLGGNPLTFREKEV